ncbi:myoneurin [Fopius arisanus]|uniref:MYNN protein n=1 Tax=Fopius arisanus TaxID=64838 RepID=A0A0C9QET8_9HYME|nr:PREDICTED: myoneurin-like [Fopius arisanus]
MRATMEQTCRLCTTRGTDYTPIFRKNDEDIVRMIRCLPVQIRPGDGLPHHICPGCLDALEVSYNLHVLCLKANLELLEKSSTLRIEKLKQMASPTRKKNESRERKSTEDASDFSKDPIIVETYHFPEAVYNDLPSYKDFSEIFLRVPAVKLERMDDCVSWSNGQDVNHNVLSNALVEHQCKLEPIDIDEAGPSGYQENVDELEDENQSSIFINPSVKPFRGPKRTCKKCGRTTSVSEFRLIRYKNKSRARAQLCNSCEVEKSRDSNPKSPEMNNHPCRSIENTQEVESGQQPDLHLSFDDFRNLHVSNEHSYARFARSCALKTIWKQQLAKINAPPREKILPNPKSIISCLSCGKKYSRYSKLKYHIAIQHTPPERWEHHCDLCGASFPIRNDLITHQASGHDSERNFMCDLCPLKFENRRKLGHHKAFRHGMLRRES